MLGLNPMEQEIIDVTNEIARNGLIYFPEFCRVVHTRYSTAQYITLQYSTVQYTAPGTGRRTRRSSGRTCSRWV